MSEDELSRDESFAVNSGVAMDAVVGIANQPNIGGFDAETNITIAGHAAFGVVVAKQVGYEVEVGMAAGVVFRCFAMSVDEELGRQMKFGLEVRVIGVWRGAVAFLGELFENGFEIVDGVETEDKRALFGCGHENYLLFKMRKGLGAHFSVIIIAYFGKMWYNGVTMITKENKDKAIASVARNKNDVGSPEVQVAILTARIKEVTEHVKNNKHDFMAKRGLMQMVGKRKKLLKYLETTDFELYKKTVAKLGLRK